MGDEVLITVLVLPSSSVIVLGAGVIVETKEIVVVAFTVEVLPATDVVESIVVDSLSVVEIVTVAGVTVLPAS